MEHEVPLPCSQESAAGQIASYLTNKPHGAESFLRR